MNKKEIKFLMLMSILFLMGISLLVLSVTFKNLLQRTTLLVLGILIMFAVILITFYKALVSR